MNTRTLESDIYLSKNRKADHAIRLSPEWRKLRDTLGFLGKGRGMPKTPATGNQMMVFEIPKGRYDNHNLTELYLDALQEIWYENDRQVKTLIVTEVPDLDKMRITCKALPELFYLILRHQVSMAA